MANYKVGCKKLKNRNKPSKIKYQSSSWSFKKNISLSQYAEPYAGGASVALKLLLNNEVKEIHINDFDKCIYNFWHSILNNTEEFIAKINNTPVNITEWQQQKEILKTTNDTLLSGFATFYLNRTNFSGVIKGGPIGGIKQNSKYKIDCRFNKINLIKKIETIAKLKNKIKLYNLDAIEFIEKIDKKRNILIYIDPPYYNKGKELYMNFYNDNNHTELEQTIKKIKNKWLLSYDKCPFIENLYKDFIINTKELCYSAGYKKVAKELLISKAG